MISEIADLRGPVSALDAAASADREAVAQVARIYALGMDTRNVEMLLSLFDPDAPLTGMLGASRAADYLPKLVAGVHQFAATLHVISNQYVVVEGDRARAWSYCRAHHAHKEEGRPPFVAAVIYKDELKRTPKGWIVTARHADHQWREGQPLTRGT
jgi:hypothetical protein